MERSDCSHFRLASFFTLSLMLDLEKKNINFGETELNFIYPRSLRIFGSLSMVDLEKKNLHLEKEK